MLKLFGTELVGTYTVCTLAAEYSTICVSCTGFLKGMTMTIIILESKLFAGRFL